MLARCIIILYGGHGLCMAWWGVTDGRPGVMAIVETPDDAAVRLPRQDGLLCLAPAWDPQKGEFGYARRLRYVFFDHGGYVAMAKRYRAACQADRPVQNAGREAAGESRTSICLVGAVNVWCWDRDAVAICRELQSAGIERILWSNAASPSRSAH